MSETTESLRDDTIYGVPAISEEIGQSERQTFHMLQNALIPAGKLGGRWIASRRALRAHFRKITGADTAA